MAILHSFMRMCPKTEIVRPIRVATVACQDVDACIILKPLHFHSFLINLRQSLFTAEGGSGDGDGDGDEGEGRSSGGGGSGGGAASAGAGAGAGKCIL